MNNVKKQTIALLLPLIIAGCTLPGSHIPTDNKHVIQAEEENTDISSLVNVYPLTPERVASFKSPEPTAQANTALDLEIAQYQYRIGAGDILNITVWDHPELTIPAGSYRSSEESGNWVNADGTIFYPYIGFVHVIGKTTREIRAEMQQRLTKYIESPQVDVNVAAFRSKKVYVTGEVDKPGQQPVTNIPMTLLDAVNLAGGLDAEADWRNVSITRDGVEQHVSLYALMQRGDLTQNRLMQSGDIIYVPSNDALKVFVMGEVVSPQTLKMDRNGMSLTEALSTVGGINEIGAAATGIFVIRPNAKKQQSDKIANVYQLNIQDATSLFLGTEFQLEPYDVVYVTATPITRWNRLLLQILPTIDGINTVTESVNRVRTW